MRWWNTLRLLRDPVGFYGGCRRRYGDSFRVAALNGDVLVTCDTSVVRDLFALRSEQVRPFGAAAAGPLFGSGSLLLLEGERHRQERRLLTPPFHGARMRAYGGTIRRVAEQIVAEWVPGQQVRAADAMLSISLEVIVRAVFGVVDDGEVRRWQVAIAELVGSLHPIVLFAPGVQRLMARRGPFARFVCARDRFDAMIRDVVGWRRRSGERGEDILSLLLDATYDDGTPMPDDAVRDELVTLLFAGHETTQIAMAWALYFLHRHPGTRDRLVAELDAASGEPAELARLPYLDAVVTEALRLNPVVPDLVRTVTEEVTLGPWTVPAGSHVSPVAALIHLREDLYPEPERWRPERHLERRFGPHELIPFGGGVRRCIGAALATYEMKVVLGTLLQRVVLESCGEDRPVRRNVAMGPRHGVPLRVVEQRTRVAAA